MREELIAQLSRPSLLTAEQGPWAEACLNGLARLSDSQREKLSEVSAYDEDFWPEEGSWLSYWRPYNVQNGILTVPVKGVLLDDFSFALNGWATGYVYLRKAMERGLEDPEVRGIALDLNTPGGAVAGNFDLADMIYEARGEKPIRAFAAEHAYSAGYSIASAADHITVARTGGVGSIGVVAWHTDMSKYLEKVGIAMTPIHAGKHKVDGNPYQKLPAGVKDRMQERIDFLYGVFVDTVARNRSMDVQAVRDTEALTYGADEAVALGLADEVGSLTDGLAAFSRDISNSYHTGGNTMSTKDDNLQGEAVSAADLEKAKADAKAEGHAEGLKEGATNERARVKAICECDEAKNRPAASFHLAVNTGMSVDDAKALLATLPEDAKVEAPARAEADATAFERAMAEGNPELGAGAGAPKTEETAADSILRDYAAAGGKLNSK